MSARSRSSGTPVIRIEGNASTRNLAVQTPALGGDRPTLDRVDVPFRLAYRAGQLQVEKLELDCDVGTAARTTFSRIGVSGIV